MTAATIEETSTASQDDVPDILMSGPGVAHYLNALADLHRITEGTPLTALQLTPQGAVAEADTQGGQAVVAAVEVTASGARGYVIGVFPDGGHGSYLESHADTVPDARAKYLTALRADPPEDVPPLGAQ